MKGDSMLSIRDEFLKLLGQVPSDWRRAEKSDFDKKELRSEENGSKYEVKLTLRMNRFPEGSELDDFLKLIKNRDRYVLSFKNQSVGQHVGNTLRVDQSIKQDDYKRFTDNFESNDDVTADLVITKNVIDGICSVYEWEAFAECLLRDSDDRNSPGFLPDYLNSLFEKHPEGVSFHVLDQKVNFATKSISFVNSVNDRIQFANRRDTLERYNGASLYMGRTENRLLPGDFHANEERSSLPGHYGQRVRELFGRYETAYSLVYLADASWFEDNVLVVQLKKGGIQMRLPVAEIRNNANIYELTDWVFDGETSVERAEIARDILAAHCRNAEDILSIEGGIKESALSSYKLFAEKVVDKYIAVKRDVIKSIFESTKQVQDLMGTLADTLGKNFVAVITVVISQVLTQNINLQKLGTKEFLNKEFQIVVAIYFVASLAYLFATLHTVYTKWQSYKERYDMIREQYEGLLYKDELDKAFDNDRLITKSKSEVFWYSCIISVLWIFMITLILMIALEANIWQLGFAILIFAGLCAWAYKNYKDEKAPFMRLGGGRKKEQDR